MKLVEVQNELRRLQYKELQAIAKSKSIRANRKKEELVGSITDNMNNQEMEDFLQKIKLEKEAVPLVKSLLIKKERRSINNYNYEARHARHFSNNNFEHSNGLWKIATPSRLSPVRSDSPLYSQFVRSDDLPRLEDSDLKEIDDGYVPNGTFIEDLSWCPSSPLNLSNNSWGAVNSPLRSANNIWSQGSPKYGHNRWGWHNNVKIPPIHKAHEQEFNRSYMPHAQHRSYATPYFGTNYGLPRFEYNYYKSVRPFQYPHNNAYVPSKRLVKPRKSLDQIHQWSDVMTSPKDPLIGSSSARNVITHPRASEQRSDCFNLEEAIKTYDLDTMNFHLENS